MMFNRLTFHIHIHTKTLFAAIAISAIHNGESSKGKKDAETRADDGGEAQLNGSHVETLVTVRVASRVLASKAGTM
jgi:hypothetical protein